ncbi:gamma-glutamyl-gamma-aminobutyrate hydrolase family protein [Paenibacillus algorifonticola]|uniref:gamma-glutamyl-gamma-aminobutyrate hydrolase family protein n=1 Tax=Paenibacillus algorifonticola TaxID=684063 RepID=UPI003D2BFB00
MGRPTIGVLPLYDGDKESYWMLPGYMKGIEDAGGIPFVLPLTSDAENITRIANMFDGFLFTGGHDINPEIYGEQIEDVCGELCQERDVMESTLFKQVIDLDKPAFGICRGLQLFNALLGGTLYQDIPAQFKSESSIKHKQAPPYSEPIHHVYIEKGNPLHRIIETENLKVNSYHHQGIKELSKQLISVAKAEDGLIEAVMMPEKKFILAVQWHPEFSYKSDQYNFRLFEEFVKSC